MRHNAKKKIRKKCKRISKKKQPKPISEGSPSGISEAINIKGTPHEISAIH